MANGREGKIVQRIITQPRASADFLEAYGEIGAVDFSAGTFTLVGRQRVGTQEESGVTTFYFDPKNITVRQSLNRQLDRTQIRSGDVVRVEFEERNGQRFAHSVKVYSPNGATVITVASRYNDNSLVGPRGPNGPAGNIGEQGLTGPTGPAGAALAGDRGAVGPAGPAGEQGFTGPRGPAGNIERGPMGGVGPSGPQGAQGSMGQIGQQGNSSNGYAGPMGAAGPQGERGPVGNAGAQGPTTYGPTGPDGYAGPAGGQGAVGEQGSQGSTTSGVAGLAGLSGPTGAPGGIGTIGEPGAPGVVGHWVFYKEINFSSNDAALSPSGMERISEIAAYMKQNPSLQIGIDGTAVNSNDQDLNDHRIVAIQQELIKDGVSADRIGRGRLDNSKFRRDGRISIFFKTA